MLGFTEGQFEDVETFAVAVRAIRIDQRHVGVLYRTTDGDLRFLHLFDENNLRCDNPSPGLRWAEAGLDETNRELLAELADILASTHVGEEFPFGIGFRGDGRPPFSGGGDWDDARSMTCATFVLALFLAHGFQLVDFTDWPERVADQAWVEALARGMVSPVDDEKLAGELKEYRRVRPEEAAVAARGFDAAPPYNFTTIEPASLRLVAAFEE